MKPWEPCSNISMNRNCPTTRSCMFVADNGWITDPKTGSYAPKSKQSQYDGGLRTPIMIRWTGHVKPSARTLWHRRSTSHPTLLAAAQLRPTPTDVRSRLT